MKSLISLTILSVFTLIAEIFNLKRLLLPLVLVGLLVVLFFNFMDWDTGYSYYNHMMYVDNYAIMFSGLLISVAILWFLHSRLYFNDNEDLRSDKYALVLFSLIGALLLTSFSNMVMLFLGVEILSIPMYILAGSKKTELASNEASMKYFLMGAFSSCFLLFGIALIYGVTGSFDLDKIHLFLCTGNAASNSLFQIGTIMIIMALSFKISAVPFHFWAPDVYQGSPTIATTFMATIVKTAAFAGLYRVLVYGIYIPEYSIQILFAVLSGLTILTGNILALVQDNVKRMLAYSSIAHAGYMLLAVMAANHISASTILLYAASYSISTIAIFSVFYLVSREKQDEGFESFRGLASRNPFLALIIVASMLSLAGIPPAAGFFAKYYLFSAALENGFIVPVLIAVAGSIISIFYYFRLIILIFSGAPAEYPLVKNTGGYNFLLGLCLFLILLLGIFPNFLVGMI